MSKQNFTVPKIVKYDDLSKQWYIHFRFNGKQKRIKAGINRFSTFKERESEAETLCKIVHNELKRGWDPFSGVQSFNRKEVLFIDALDFALEKKKSALAKKSYFDYRTCLRHSKESIMDLRLDHLFVSDVTRFHIKSIMEQTQIRRKWSNKAYNKNLGYFKSIISELIEWELIDSNPAHGIRTKKIAETPGHIPPTDYEQNLIRMKLIEADPNFFRFVQLIYHTGIRPGEVLKMRIKDISLSKQLIVLPPNNTKTLKYRAVPINNHLYRIFMEMDLHQHPDDYFLFGSFRKPGMGNVGKYPDFVPGPTKIRVDTATARWRKYVKKELGIQKNLYSEKHKGANDKIIAGIDLDALRELYGHRSKMMTEKYAKIVKDIYRKQIIDKSPEF
ncbi:MAG: tyrosine-type recombinase/integrase [Moheibacter sp.]